MRLLFVLILWMAVAAGLYFSGTISEFLGNAISSEKLRAVKPEFTHEKVAEPVFPEQDYTFFKTLNDPTMTQYVDLKGRLMTTALSPEKTAVTPAKIKASTPPAGKTEKSGSAAKFKIKQNPKSTTSVIPEINALSRYAVQVSSFQDKAHAVALKMRLLKNGFDAFLMQTELVDHGGTWHRVFLGRYADDQKAQEAAHLARTEYQLNAVVVRKTN